MKGRRLWGTSAVLLTLIGPLAGLASGGRTIPQAAPAVDGNRAPYDLVFSPDGTRAYVTEMAEGTVAVVDAVAGKVLRRMSTNGRRPAGLAVTPDGRLLVVGNSYSASVALIDTDSGTVRTVALPGEPVAIALSPDGRRAYVALSQLGEVVSLYLPDGQVEKRIAVGRRPRSLAVTPDGKTLAVGNSADGTVSVIETATFTEQARVKLKGINIRGVAIAKGQSGPEAFATVMPAFNRKATSDPKEVWHNLIQAVRLSGPDSRVGEDQWMDFARLEGQVEVVGSPDQHDIVVDRDGKLAWISVSGRDVVTRVTLNDTSRISIWPFFQAETPVGAVPKGLELTPDGKELWVANHLGNSLTVVDAVRGNVLRTISLGPASEVDPTIMGQYLFHNAAFTRAHRFTCASCHPEGASDGLTWSFVHVKDGFDRRNSRDLRSGVDRTAPFRWSGHDEGIHDFIKNEITGLLGGPELRKPQLDAVSAAIARFEAPPNPYRQANGEFTPLAQQGQALFVGKAGCTLCHNGPQRGGTGTRTWVGTTPPGMLVDVPHLANLYDSGPYLHDGRAETLEAVFEKYNDRRLHGKMHELSETERAAVLRFLREL